ILRGWGLMQEGSSAKRDPLAARRKTSPLSESLPFILLGLAAALIAAFVPQRSSLVLLAVLTVSFILTLGARPFRSLLAWAATIGVQLSYEWIPVPRLGVADLF